VIRNGITPQQLFNAYERGENITRFLRQAGQSSQNTQEIIEIAYDLQAGSYVERMTNPRKREFITSYSAAIANEIRKLVRQTRNVLEAGVGEATTLSGVLKSLEHDPRSAYGFDISWSRIAKAREWLAREGLPGVHLCTASLSEIPYSDNAFDIVYTSHAIEPNGGDEIPILKELYRVTGRYLLLFEPSYEMANSEGKKRMREHGYCRGLEQKCRQLGFEILEVRRFEKCANPLNPTMALIIKKSAAALRRKPRSVYVCPVFKSPLAKRKGVMVAATRLLVYPIIDDIPCLRVSNAIVASHFGE
jgi:SAM-dependent methyltransferase